MKETRYISLRDAAKRIGVHPDTLKRWRLRGLIRTVKLPGGGHRITIEELEPYNIQRGERILFKTLNSERQWKTDEFLTDYVYIPVATAQYLADRGVRTIGVDALSVGGWEDQNAECHRVILGAGIWIVEWLDLSKVEPGDYELACLPLLLVGSEGSPARAALRKL